MTLFENTFVRYALVSVGALFLAALLYFIYVGVRALFRDAKKTAQETGYRDSSATVHAMLRMAIWALFFGTFYLLAFFVGKRLGWWALPVAVLALVAMIWGLLLADRLLTVSPDDLRQQAGIGVTVAILLALFAGVIWLAV